MVGNVAAALAVGVGTLNTGLTVLVLALGGALTQVVLTGLATTLVSVSASFIIARRLVPGLVVRPHFERAMFKELFGFGMYFLLSQLGVLLLYQADKLLIGAFLSVAAVTYYVVPGNLATRIQGLVAAATSIVFPVSSALFEQGLSESLTRLYREGTRLVMILATSVSVPLAVYAGKFLLYWMGEDIARNSATVMVVLVATYYVLSLSSIPWGIANGSGRAKVNAVFTLFIAAADIALFVVLVGPFGLVGAASAYLISAVVGVPALVAYLERDVVGLSGAEFLKIGWRVWLVGAVQAALALITVPLVTNLLVTLILMVASVVSFYALYVLIGFVQPGDREVARMLIGRLRARGAA
jgi:O-antigen/teichoic acid export membrane protein